VQIVSEASRGQHGPVLVNQLRGAAAQAIALYGMAGVDFAELAADIEAEMRSIATVQAEIDQLDTRIQRLYLDADPDQIVQTAPGVGPVLAPAIHGLFGDPHRFANLAAARAFTGLVPDTNESGISQAPARPTKAGDPGLRNRPARRHPARCDGQAGELHPRDVLRARRSGTLDKSQSPSPQGHPHVTARSTPQADLWIRA
jgi:transposase